MNGTRPTGLVGSVVEGARSNPDITIYFAFLMIMWLLVTGRIEAAAKVVFGPKDKESGSGSTTNTTGTTTGDTQVPDLPGVSGNTKIPTNRIVKQE